MFGPFDVGYYSQKQCDQLHTENDKAWEEYAQNFQKKLGLSTGVINDLPLHFILESGNVYPFRNCFGWGRGLDRKFLVFFFFLLSFFLFFDYI